MEQILQQYNSYILLGVIAFSIIILILFIITMMKFKQVQARYKALTIKEGVDLDALLLDYVARVEGVEQTHAAMQEQLNTIQKKITYCTQKVGVVRYDAFEKGGADLSFAIALLDDYDNGVVLNGIYSRDGSYIYAKPVQQGISKHNLSDEEKEAIQKAQTNA